MYKIIKRIVSKHPRDKQKKVEKAKSKSKPCSELKQAVVVKEYIPKTVFYTRGIEWRIDLILNRLIPDANERYKLMCLFQSHVAGAYSRREDPRESLIHNLIVSLPDDSQYEIYKYLNAKIIEIVIEDGNDATKPNQYGDPPILAAYKINKRHAVIGFLNKRVDINVTDRYGASLLILACKDNDADTAIRIVSMYRSGEPKLDLDALDLTKNSALSYAALNNNLLVCKSILEAGANPNASYTSILYQIIKNDCSDDLFKLLIDYKASVETWIDFTGLTPLIATANKNRTEAVLMLLRAGAQFTSTWHQNKAFVHALKWDNLDIVTHFINRSVEITSKTARGTNILHEITINGSTKCLRYVICNTDIDLNTVDRYGRTAFFLASEHGHCVCLDLLYQASANCFKPDINGRTPLDLAIFNKHERCVEFMLSNPVCPRSDLVNVCYSIKDEYDQAEFRLINSANHVRNLSKLYEDGNVDPLRNLCVLKIRRIIGQRNSTKIDTLPLPMIMKRLLM